MSSNSEPAGTDPASLDSNPMSSDRSPTRPGSRRGPAAGLCETCAFQRTVPNTRGSVFSLCNRSREDPSYPRYPRLPVLDCVGYERRSNEGS